MRTVGFRECSCLEGLDQLPGNSAVDLTLLGWLSDPLNGENVTSNWGIKRSRNESPGHGKSAVWVGGLGV